MKRFILFIALVTMFSAVSYANDMNQIITSEDFNTVYTEVPVSSYYAYPDDPNFIPESEFMDMGDTIDYDEVIY
nr:hypothetical protein [Candidatus Enterousia merdequi]